MGFKMDKELYARFKALCDDQQMTVAYGLYLAVTDFCNKFETWD